MFYATSLELSKGYLRNRLIVDTGAFVTMLTKETCRLIISGGMHEIYKASTDYSILLSGIADVGLGHKANLYYMCNIIVGGLKFSRFYFFVPEIEANLDLLGMDIIGRSKLVLDSSNSFEQCIENFNIEEYLKYYDNVSGYDNIIFPQLAVFTE